MARFITAFICCAFLTGFPALAEPDHPLVRQHSWISKHDNAKGQNCCGPRDTYRLTYEQAAGLKIGSTVTVSEPNGQTYTFTVNKIYPSQDPNGLPWITRYGCLFQPPGV